METYKSELRLSVQRGLLVNLTYAVRGVSVITDDNKIKLYFYYDGKVTEKIQSNFESAVADIVSDFPSEVVFEEFLIRVDYPYKLPADGNWMHLRYEKNSSDIHRDIKPNLKSSLFTNLSKRESTEIPFSEILTVLKLSAQQALLGRVFSTLRAVSVNVSSLKNEITVFMYYDGEITDEIHRLFKMFTDDIRLDFYQFFKNADKIKFKFLLEHLNEPEPLPFRGDNIFRRDEDIY